MSVFSGLAKRFILVLLAGFCGIACNDHQEPAQIYPGLPENIRYVKLSQSLYTSTPQVVANGSNAVKFYLEFFDADRKPVTSFATPASVKLRINATDELSYPLRFQTTVPGVYTFTLEGFPEGSMLNKSVTITAIADKTYEPVKMPVIFHYIIAPGQPLDMAQVTTLLRANIDQLNRAFRNGDDSQDANAVDMKVSFELAAADPDGTQLAIPGLHLVESADNVFENKDDPKLDAVIWAGNYWSPKHYLNVWICSFTDKYSYGNFPSLAPSAADFPDFNYGVFFHASHFKTSSTETVLIHEVGHVLNLFHVFDPSCSRDPDSCDDTEQYERSYGEDAVGGLQRTSCFEVRFISDNYMDYWPNEYNTFTYDQRERVRKTLDQCPFLPTPRNGFTGGRQRVPVSNRQMPHHSRPEQGTF